MCRPRRVTGGRIVTGSVAWASAHVPTAVIGGLKPTLQKSANRPVRAVSLHIAWSHTVTNSMTRPLNIADRLRQSARLVPDQAAIVIPHAAKTARKRITFAELDAEVDAIARGLIEMGVEPWQRLVLMVRPSIEFIALTFGIFRSGAVCTLIDPGMGRSRIFDCLKTVDPDGFVAIPAVHVIRKLMPLRFRNARFNINVGRMSWLLGCRSYSRLVGDGAQSEAKLPATMATDAAAIIFTSGSTGPPKGVVYEHGMFDAQVDLIRDQYQIAPGEIDLPGFPLFALFNLAMQVTTVVPDMDPTKPATVDPEKILTAMMREHVTQAYGSPAMWNRIGRYCESNHLQLPRLNRVLSAGAPVPLHVLRRMTSALRHDADLHTPYGATECLPVASIGAREVLSTTAPLTANGHGICVGRVFKGVDVRIITITDGPIASIDDAGELPAGEIGEIIVRGPVATREYFRSPEATSLAKIADGDTFWHRMGDCGYFDEAGRLWFCGRKAHIVWTTDGPMHSVCCEEIINTHPAVYRSALVGVGFRGSEMPVLFVEPESGQLPQTDDTDNSLRADLLELAASHPLTAAIQKVLFSESFPVDTRHNIKIDRDFLRRVAGTVLLNKVLRALDQPLSTSPPVTETP